MSPAATVPLISMGFEVDTTTFSAAERSLSAVGLSATKVASWSVWAPADIGGNCPLQAKPVADEDVPQETAATVERVPSTKIAYPNVASSAVPSAS